MAHRVRLVLSALIVIGTAAAVHAAPFLSRSDAAVKRDVQRALSADRSLADSSISVRSVNGGIVLLSGSAASSDDFTRAFRAAGQRPGVVGVVSEVQAPVTTRITTLRPGQLGVVSEVRVPVTTRITTLVPIRPAPAVQLAPVDFTDDTIRRGVEQALIDLDADENADVNVRVEDGVVWLYGSVPTWQGTAARLHAVRSVTGVRSIMNELRVVASSAARR